MRLQTTLALAACALLPLAGCKKTADVKPNYEKALNTYYSAYPQCLFPDEIKFPVQSGADDSSKTSQYDALVDQGLLTRTSAEKKELLILSKHVVNYDLSDKGRGAWTADPQQPGSGNFCYGTYKVSSIDSSTPTNDQPGATTTVNYHVELSGAPGWASAAETQNAYPDLKAALAGPAPSSATLTDTADGWKVTTGPLRAKHAVSNADYGIVH